LRRAVFVKLTWRAVARRLVSRGGTQMTRRNLIYAAVGLIAIGFILPDLVVVVLDPFLNFGDPDKAADTVQKIAILLGIGTFIGEWIARHPDRIKLTVSLRPPVE
jgi:hypothetical protein